MHRAPLHHLLLLQHHQIDPLKTRGARASHRREPPPVLARHPASSTLRAQDTTTLNNLNWKLQSFITAYHGHHQYFKTFVTNCLFVAWSTRQLNRSKEFTFLNWEANFWISKVLDLQLTNLILFSSHPVLLTLWWTNVLLCKNDPRS